MRMTKAKLAATGNGLHVNVDRLKDDTDLSSLVSGNMQTQEKKSRRGKRREWLQGKKKMCFRHVKSDFNSCFAWLKPKLKYYDL